MDPQPQTSHYTPDSEQRSFQPASNKAQGAHATAAVSPSLHNLGQTHTHGHPQHSAKNRISYRVVVYLSISQPRPVITTHGSVSNRINRQTPVGGPMQLSGVLHEIISQPLSRHHTRTDTLTSVRLNPSRPGLFRSDQPVNVA